MKYYYTDPLAIEWMADKFGMTYHIADDKKTFIHPDSLHLLEARKGDMVTGYNRYDTEYCIVPYGSWHMKYDNMKIIQREGIAFMWPNAEE